MMVVILFSFCLAQVLNSLANSPDEETPKSPKVLKRSQSITGVTEPSVKRMKSETTHTPIINEKDIKNEQKNANEPFSFDSAES